VASELVDGVLVIDKPQGLTSHDVVAVARRALGERRVGHTGTLDPLATGVLPLVCGQATRLARFLAASDKEYEATVRFGMTTDSYDVTGIETSRSGLRPERDSLTRALASLTGTYLQLPPAFSAKKVAGRRAYDMARQEQPVELTPVPVTVTRADLETFTGDTAQLRVVCSAGFYVRAFTHALGGLTGTGACLEALRRTRSGEFTLAQAVTVEQLSSGDTPAAAVVPMNSLLTALPVVTVTEEGRNRVSHGQEVEGTPGTAEWVRLIDARGRLVAIAKRGSRPGSLHPAVVLI
jgi:tRNA pseudouridine55 synthase